MNKVREILEKIKRHQFWILCGIVALVGIVSWWMSTRSLADTYSQNKAKIESFEQKIKSVDTAPQHPNDNTIQLYKSQTEAQKKQVYDAWQRIYDEQKAKIYVWPADVLGKEFVDYVTKLGPSEEIESEFRSFYQTWAINHFKKFAKIVEAEWVDPESQEGSTEYGRGPTRSVAGRQSYKVEWAPEKFRELQMAYRWPETPTTKQILYAQEEMWVLEALCRAIAEANKDSTGAHNAAVRRIDEVMVAFLAAEENPLGFGESNRIAKPLAEIKVGEDAAADPAAAPGAPLPRPERTDLKATSRDSPSYATRAAAPQTPSPDGDAAAAGPVSVDDALMNWRYVDNKGKPLMGSELAGQGGEYRLSPWRLKVVVDQRQLDTFLIAFRNTVMPLEIKQVRVNPELTTPMIGAAAAGENRGGYGSTDRGGGGGYGQSQQSTLDLGGTVAVELRGVAYLFNSPETAKAGVGAADSDAGETNSVQ